MKRLLFFALLFFLGAIPPLWALQPLTLNPSDGSPLSNPDQSGYFDLILRESFSRLGIPITFGQLSAERSLQSVNSGIDDGDFVRIAGLEKSYPNLIMVPEELDNFEFVAFSQDLDLVTNSWAALVPYHVGIVRGWKILEQNLSGVKELTAVKNQEQLFRLLKNGRVEVIVYSRNEGNYLLSKLGMENVRVLEPPLAVRPMYLYLNKKHLGLVAPLAVVLKEMKEEGIFSDIAQKTLTVPLQKEEHGAYN